MLRLLDTDESRPPPAYRVPWGVDRSGGAHALIANESTVALDFVRVFLDVDGVSVGTQLWGQMLPGEKSELCLCDVDLDRVVVTLAWFRPENGLEYVWRFVL